MDNNNNLDLNMIEIERKEFAIGDTFTYFGNSASLIGQDGVLFEALDLNQGYLHSVFYTAITPEEVYVMTRLRANMRIIESPEGYVLLLIKYGDTELVQEMFFDPTLYEDKRALQFLEDNNIMTIVCLDSLTNTIRGFRSANLPLKMIQRCKKSWRMAYSTPSFSEDYSSWCQLLQAQYTTIQLWNAGEDVGYLGESYDLKDI